MKRLIQFCLFSLFLATSITAQNTERREKLEIDGQIVTALITETNDTILIADLDEMSISSIRKFDSRQDELRYKKYRRYAAKVYPYAVEGIRIFREQEFVTQNMSKRKRKKHIKRLQKELKKEFKDPLKKLSKTQGKILIKMIEKELDTPFYDLLKNLRGSFQAMYWNNMSKFFGYRLKEGYVEGNDKILDAVLHDFDISHEIDYKTMEHKWEQLLKVGENGADEVDPEKIDVKEIENK